MTKLGKLSVLENNILEWGWSVGVDADNHVVTSSDIRFIESDVMESIHLCGAYKMADVSYEIYNVEYKEIEGMEVYKAASKAISDKCYEALTNSDGLLINGGFCTYVPAYLGGLQRAIGVDKKIGLIYFDRHSDMETPQDSVSHIIAGLPLSASVGLCMDDWRKISGLTKPIPGKNTILTDFRSRNPKSADAILKNIEKAGIRLVDSEELADIEQWKNVVRELADRVDVIFLHIDIDVLDAKYVPAFEFPLKPEKNDLDIRDLITRIKIVMDTGKVKIYDVSNVDFGINHPQQDTMTLSSMKLIGAGLQNWKNTGL